jgi:hypothetical protein
MHKALGLILAATMAVLAACGSDGGGSGDGGAAPAGDRAAATTTSPTADEPADDAGAFTDECPAADDVSARLGTTMTLSQAGLRERVIDEVPEFGCTYLGPDDAHLAIAGNRDRFDDDDDADYELDVHEFGDPGDANAAGPLDSERDLDLGDRAYTNSRVNQRNDGQGYEVHAWYAARLGTRVCYVTVYAGKAAEPALTAAQDAVGLSVLSALCDL